METTPNDNILELVKQANALSIKEPALLQQLTGYVNHLIAHDFERLVSILYRMDVSEKKIREMLQEQGGANAGEHIATMIIERQLQKIKSRQEHTRRDQEYDSDEERW
ncbi:MAG: hypothetical protein EOO03_05135 [Chitinophagaceae bacterium]|nr:MAG: hypothetical protein EOO03_05135 [Chitinophagaceae bacterium]